MVAPSPPDNGKSATSASIPLGATTATMSSSSAHHSAPSNFSTAQYPSTTASTYSTAVPGSARALARMIHFSNGGAGSSAVARCGSSVRQTLVAATESGVPSEMVVGDRWGGEQGMGGWTKADNQEGASGMDCKGRTSNHGVADVDRDHGPSTSGEVHEVSLNTKHGGDRTNGGRQTISGPVTESGVRGVDQRWFVLRDGAASLAGLWYVEYAQGYPYYVHEASGHSQWEDPRPTKERVDSPTAGGVTDFLAESTPANAGHTTTGSTRAAHQIRSIDPVASSTGINSLNGSGCTPEEGNPDDDGARDCEQKLPASPMKPVGVTIAVDVPRFVDISFDRETREVIQEPGDPYKETKEGGRMSLDEEVKQTHRNLPPSFRNKSPDNRSRTGGGCEKRESDDHDSASNTDSSSGGSSSTSIGTDSDTGSEASSPDSEGKTISRNDGSDGRDIPRSPRVR